MSVAAALAAALREQPAGKGDEAVVELARRYAEQLDEDLGRLPRLGRPFLSVLVELRLTPQARAGVLGGMGGGDDVEPDEQLDDGGEGDQLADLRRRRGARQYGAETVDPSAP